MTSSDIETIERATIAAVSPEAFEEFEGWILPFDSGTVSRARSAVPLRHRPADASMVGQIEARYQTRGLPPVFRLANEACFDGLRLELIRRGYQSGRPVLVQVAPVEAMRKASAELPAETASSPDAAWAALFLAEGFDPVDGASRVKALSRAGDSVYASVRENGKTVAAGAGAFNQGWSSVHGMRTDQACRGRGLAGRGAGRYRRRRDTTGHRAHVFAGGRHQRRCVGALPACGFRNGLELRLLVAAVGSYQLNRDSVRPMRESALAG